MIEKNNWNELRIADYKYRIYNSKPTPSAYSVDSIVIVRNGEYYHEIRLGSEEDFISFVNDGNNDRFMTIDNLYKFIEEALTKYKKERMNFFEGYCKNIIIEFDKKNHIPILIVWEFWHNPFLNFSDNVYYSGIQIEDFIIE